MNKKGFTLIELLAVIIILGLLATIITPKITKTLKEAEAKTNMTSAQNLVKAAEYKVANNDIKGTNEDIIIDYTNNINTNYLDYSGEKPEIGQVQIRYNGTIAMSLKFGDYCYTKGFNSDEITTTSYNDQTCGENASVFISVRLYKKINNELVKIDKSEMQSGDIVVLKLGDIEEKFIVISDSTHIDSKAPAGTTTLLAVNNLNVGPNKDTSLSEGYQGANGTNYIVAFAETKYWMSNDEVDIYDSSKDEAPGNDYYSVAYYVNMYVENLQNLGFTGINSGRILTYVEVDAGGIAESYKVSGEKYWLSYQYFNNVCFVNVNDGDKILCGDGIQMGYAGVRPVIYINTNDIE